MQIITTVGTSIITNNLRNCDKKFKDWFDEIKKSSRFDIEDPAFIEFREIVRKNGGDKSKRNYKLSAEITSLNMLKNDEKYKKEQNIKVKFILTDTVEANYARVLLEDFLKHESRFEPESLKEGVTITGLQVSNPKIFEDEGLLNLINEVINIKENAGKEKVILNLTGGYKGMIPFLTLFGQLYEIEINYIYEFSDKMIKFPQLPIQFDWLKAETYYNYLKKNISYSENDELLDELERYYLIKTDHTQKDYTVTSVGKLFANYIKEKVIVDDSVMGHTMEYKLLEYYMENPYENHYFYLKRSFPLTDPETPKGTDKMSDIDLLMKKNKDSEEFISIENKPYISIIDAFDEKGFKKQLTTQLNLFSKNNWYPEKYLLHIYADNEKVINKESLKAVLQELDKIVRNETPEIKFGARIFYTGILSPKNKKQNPYKEFMSKKLEKIEDFNF